jgi:DNA-binding MarR family transcriptional regulator
MSISLPSETVFHSIERAIKEYRKFSQKNISNQIKDLTIDQGMVLLFLDKHSELTQKEIAALIFKDNASMTRMINLMVNKKYLKRSMNPLDRRRYNIEITAKGKQVLESLPPIILSNREKSLEGITKEEIIQLESLLKKITSNCTKS